MSFELRDIVMDFPGTRALDAVSCEIRLDEVHGLIGENGAGKSTLVSILAGVQAPTAGVLLLDGQPLVLKSAIDALGQGIGFVSQEGCLAPSLSGAENILLGHRVPDRLGLFVNWADLKRRAQSALAALGADHIDARGHAGDLGTGDRMLIKLASALVAEVGAGRPRLYVLDEPTAALQEAEVERLFRVLRQLRDGGAAILYVSHRMEEIAALCDEVTVLRNGRRISTRALADTDRAQIVLDMTGKAVGTDIAPRRHAIGEAILCDVSDLATPALSGINLQLRAGEVIGLAGLAGAGQAGLLRVFLGLVPIRAGTVRFDGGSVPRSPAFAWARGVAYVPQERRSEGLMMRMGVRPNILVPHLPGFWAKRRRETARTQDLSARVMLKSDGPEQSVWQLSGGNQQKVVFARALAGQPRLLLLDEPTRGVDIAARREIHALIRNLSAQGCGTLVASSDLPELIGLSDRILILRDGVQREMIPAAGLTPEDLLHRLYEPGRGEPA